MKTEVSHKQKLLRVQEELANRLREKEESLGSAIDE
jgi:hypothetical protein